ncbi:MAG: aspartate aminotransferase family protein [Acidimicrobiaceae bacterium]|nr:aspartate aminotransferase family protein [Acidimicrobiaceae bacterium]
MINSSDITKLNSEEVLKLYKNYINPQQAKLYAGLSMLNENVISAEGVKIQLSSGKEITDFTGGLGVLNHGHNHPKIIEARINFQEEKRMEVTKVYLSPYVAALSKNIAELFPGDLDISYFCNSGSEGIEGALKMCHKSFSGSRDTVLSSNRSFHGKTLGALSVSHASENTYLFPKIMKNFTYQFNDEKDLERAVNESLNSRGESNLFALLIEPFSASSFSESSNSFLKKARDLSNRFDIPLVFDEIYTGFYKTGPLFSFMKTEVVPDIVVYSKSFGGGKSSISGFTATKKLFNNAYGNLDDALMHSTTYNAFGEETYSALVAIEVAIEENFQEKSKNIEKAFNLNLDRIKNDFPIISGYSGTGSLFGVCFDLKDLYGKLGKIINTSTKEKIEKVYIVAIIDYLYKEHNYLTYFTDNQKMHLAIGPSLVIDPVDVENFFSSFRSTLEQNQVKLFTNFVTRKGLGNIKLLFK